MEWAAFRSEPLQAAAVRLRVDRQAAIRLERLLQAELSRQAAESGSLRPQHQLEDPCFEARPQQRRRCVIASVAPRRWGVLWCFCATWHSPGKTTR